MLFSNAATAKKAEGPNDMSMRQLVMFVHTDWRGQGGLGTGSLK